MSQETQKRPYHAILAGLLFPGGAQLFMGRTKAGWMGFGVVSLMTFVGWLILGARLFAFTENPFSGNLAVLHFLPVHLLPEAGNLGEMTLLWLAKGGGVSVDFEALRVLKMPVSYEHLGFALMGMAGVLNALLASEGLWLLAGNRLPKGPGSGPRLIALILGWLIPGWGHLALGRKRSALFVFIGLMGLFVMGLFFSDLRGVDRSLHYWWWAGQSGLGLPTFLSSIFLGPLEVTKDNPHFELGMTLISIGGLLNFAILADLFTLRESDALGISSSKVMAGPVEAGGKE
jgi:hypothetical protein